jgi:hypothetical protein
MTATLASTPLMMMVVVVVKIMMEKIDRTGGKARTQSRDQTDAETGEETAGRKERNAGGSGLQDNAKDEDEVGRNETPATTDMVTHGRGEERAEESSGRKDGHDQRGLFGRDIEFVVDFVDEAGGEGVSPVGHGKNTTNRARVITIQQEISGSFDSTTNRSRPVVRPAKDALRPCNTDSAKDRLQGGN